MDGNAFKIDSKYGEFSVDNENSEDHIVAEITGK